MRTFVVLALVLCLAIMPVAVAHGEVKDAWDDWYAMLEVQAGTTMEVKSTTFRPYIAGKVCGYKAWVAVLGTEFDIDEKTEAEGPVAGLLGATYNLGTLKDHGVDIAWAKHIGFNIGLCGTWEFETGDLGWRAMLSIVDIGQSEGNAEKQRNR